MNIHYLISSTMAHLATTPTNGLMKTLQKISMLEQTKPVLFYGVGLSIVFGLFLVLQVLRRRVTVVAYFADSSRDQHLNNGKISSEFQFQMRKAGVTLNANAVTVTLCQFGWLVFDKSSKRGFLAIKEAESVVKIYQVSVNDLAVEAMYHQEVKNTEAPEYRQIHYTFKFKRKQYSAWRLVNEDYVNKSNLPLIKAK